MWFSSCWGRWTHRGGSSFQQCSIGLRLEGLRSSCRGKRVEQERCVREIRHQRGGENIHGEWGQAECKTFGTPVKQEEILGGREKKEGTESEKWCQRKWAPLTPVSFPYSPLPFVQYFLLVDTFPQLYIISISRVRTRAGQPVHSEHLTQGLVSSRYFTHMFECMNALLNNQKWEAKLRTTRPDKESLITVVIKKMS